MKNKKGDIELDKLIAWIIGILVLVIVLGLIYLVLTGKLSDASTFIKNLFRFR